MALTTGTPELDSNFKTISVVAPFTTSDAAAGNGVTVRYRRTVGPGAWHEYSASLVKIDTRETLPGAYGAVNWAKNQARFKLVKLTANTAYTVEITFIGTVTGTNPITVGISTVDDTPPAPAVRTLYCDGDAADDTGTGLTTGSPKKLIQSVFNMATAGDQIFINPKAASAPYVLTAANQARLLADGTAENWIRVTKWTGAGARAGTVIIEGNGSISDIVNLAGSYQRLDNITMRKATAGSVLAMSAYYAGGEKWRWVDHCVITDWNINDAGGGQNAGLYAPGNPERCILHDNTFQRRDVVAGNQAGKGYAVAIQNQASVGTYGGRHIIFNNTVIGGADGISGFAENDARGGWYINTDIYDNDISNCEDDGLSLDGAAVNLAAWGNKIHDVFEGHSVNPIVVGPAYVFRNEAWDIKYKQGEWLGVYAYKFGSASDGQIYIMHESTYAPEGNGFAQTDSGLANFWIRNCAVQSKIGGTNYRIIAMTSKIGDGGVQSTDYNCLYPIGPTSDNAIQWWSTYYTSLATYQSGTGNEASGLSQDMTVDDWESAATGDFRLKTGSLLIDAGLIIPGINSDMDDSDDNYLGVAPDIGGLEATGVIPLTYELVIDATSNGSIKIDGVTKVAGTYPYIQDSTHTIEAVADSGYSWSAWTGDALGKARVDSLLFDGNKQIGATFVTATTWNLAVEYEGDVTATLDPAGGQYADLTDVEVTAVPGTNSEFVAFEGDASGTNPATVSMTADKKVKIVAKKTTYLVRIRVRGTGTTTPVSGRYSFTKGETVVLRALPIGTCLGWEKDGVLVTASPSYHFSPTAAGEMTAVFSS